jgi:hypothetical protein
MARVCVSAIDGGDRKEGNSKIGPRAHRLGAQTSGQLIHDTFSTDATSAYLHTLRRSKSRNEGKLFRPRAQPPLHDGTRRAAVPQEFCALYRLVLPLTVQRARLGRGRPPAKGALCPAAHGLCIIALGASLRPLCTVARGVRHRRSLTPRRACSVAPAPPCDLGSRGRARDRERWRPRRASSAA